MKYFKITLLAIVSLFFVTACEDGSGVNEYTLSVSLEGYSEGNDLFMQELSESGYAVTDTAELTESGFVFKGKIEQPKLVYLTSNAFRGAIPVFAEAGNIRVTARVDSLSNAKITGSSAHDFFAKTNAKLADFDKLWQDFYYGAFREMGKEEQALNEEKIDLLYDSAQRLKAAFLEVELLENRHQAATAVLVLNNIDAMEISASQAIYDKLTPENIKSSTAKELAKRIEVIKKTSVGQPLIDFTMNDTLGYPIALSEYASGKYVLVDFWAAWCAPCRKENPNVVANFMKYQDKGFTVFGVSFDQKKENWIKAIQDDGLIWGHVSDLQGWANEAGKLYGIQSIPQNILLDPNGIIIEKNLRGSALGEKLEGLLSE